MAILDDIFAKSASDLNAKKKKISNKEALNMAYLELLAEQSLKFKPRDPQALLKALKKDGSKHKIIAEIKKASPSKGLIRENFNYIRIAHDYEENGAAAISVLTEKNFFQGDLEYLQNIAQSVKTPLLRKDFIFDEYQILESVVAGADFILLIAKRFESENPDKMKALADLARKFKMEVLFEIHSEKELEWAMKAEAKIIGVNNRNLSDFSVDLKLSEKLLPQIPADIIKVAESGIHDKTDLKTLSAFGADAFLIGEYFMRQNDCGAALREFVSK